MGLGSTLVEPEAAGGWVGCQCGQLVCKFPKENQLVRAVPGPGPEPEPSGQSPCQSHRREVHPLAGLPRTSFDSMQIHKQTNENS